jgi:hypothetical protein
LLLGKWHVRVAKNATVLFTGLKGDEFAILVEKKGFVGVILHCGIPCRLVG